MRSCWSSSVLVAIGTAACATGAPRQPTLVDAREATIVSAVASACATDFDTLYSIVTHDYAGYQDRIRESGARISAVADSVRATIPTVATDSACTATLKRWTAIFREHDNHFQFWESRPERAQSTATPGRAADSARRSTLRFIDDSTTLITLPDFAGRYKPGIDSLVNAHRSRLGSMPYLVIDLRRNPGGATSAYRNIMALLYTDPIQREGFDVWVSPGTIAAARPFLDDPSADSASKVEMRNAIQRYEATRQPFFLEGKGGQVLYDSVYAMPRAVAVLTGRGCVSSCEQFVLDAMYSKKVTVFGSASTGGFLDYGNISYVTLPSGIRRLGTATTRSRRLPARPFDKTGIAPQVTIPKDERDPIAFAIAYLKAGRAAPNSLPAH
jgi:peptidase S41-like protein